MRVDFILLSFSLSFFSACNVLSGGDSDDGPSRNIVFSASDGGFQVFTMREDGSGVRQLTDGEFSSTEPAWSPDGTRIAYARSTGSTAGEELWVMDADGSNKEPLVINPRTGSPQLGNRPAWSPDGTKLAFDRCMNCEFGGSNFEILVADLQAGTIDTLTDHPVEDSHPIWNPDGKQIAFTSNRDYFDADTMRWRKDLYIMNTAETKLERLTENGFVGRLSWHPEGENIVFAANGLLNYNFDTDSVSTINLNLENARPVEWSYDGQQLLFVMTEEFPKSAFYLFNNNLNAVERISFDSRQIMGADWFTSFDNQN